MENEMIQNPFIVGKSIPEEYFCDREAETKFLIKNIVNGRNVALISPRRLGKTGLIKHCFCQPEIKDCYRSFFIDIYSTSSLSEFVYLLGKAIFEDLKPRKTIWRERFFQIITSLRMGFRLDALTGEPTFDIGLGEIVSPQTTLDEIFTYLEESDMPCVVAIDEFQQIATYAEKNVEALLRTKIQQCRKTMFVFAGSKRHLMAQMFTSPSKPFYSSSVVMGLEPIPLPIYADFAERLFEARGRKIDKSVTEQIYNRYEGYTLYVQMMMNELYSLTAPGANCSVSMVTMARKNIISTQAMAYKEILANLSIKQKLVLQAIAREKRAEAVTSMAFVKKYNLGSASIVQSAIRGLIEKDIITQTDGVYRVYDYFFADWLVEEY